ncbi:MAG: FAD-dependent oxidoreductase [Candidatus Thermoplasmatota archaeon]|nr:FAD-dependent oxidoreductase [Candidatus Thermoplasmatota archaeon]MCL5793840.1 FAD-dependent oxidoreductase [Candidatus Thermoplasmatota archaeon]
MISTDADYDIVIIGGASAGLTAAIYSSRQGMKTLVITKDIGGQALLTDEIQNYPGFLNISGFDLMVKFQQQAQTYGAEFLYDEVNSIQTRENSFIIGTGGRELTAHSVILAFGKTPRDLGVPGEERLKGKGISYCAICDGPLFRNKTVAVAGNGDHALQAALYLSGVARKTYLVYRPKKLRTDDELANTVMGLPNVEVIPGSTVEEAVGETKLSSVSVKTDAERELKTIEIQGLFVEMGYVAKTDFVKDLVRLNEQKEIVVNDNGETSMRGVFAAGDVTHVPYKQAVISAGQGATAALSAYNYVQKLKGKTAVKSDWRSIKPVNN